MKVEQGLPQDALDSLVKTLAEAVGLQQKADIQLVQRNLEEAHTHCYPNGDDAAVIASGDGFDLLAGEGFMDQFVAADPWFAGWCGVMVNVSDIAAMGGRPVAVVNALWGGADERTEQLLQGMSAASRAYAVPIVGGHTNLRCEQLRLSVSIFGRASHLLSSFSAKPGQLLVMAVDLRGHYQSPFNNWKGATGASAQQLQGDIVLLPKIAEQRLATAAKDISQAGVLGTCLMLLESSGVGAHIRLDDIPKPPGVELLQWLQTFPSFGYLLCCDESKLPIVLQNFTARDISAAVIGEINSTGLCTLASGSAEARFWNIATTPLTGMKANHTKVIGSNNDA